MKHAKKALRGMPGGRALTAVLLAAAVWICAAAATYAEETMSENAPSEVEGGTAAAVGVVIAGTKTGSVPLFATEDEGGEVLMNYFSGAVLEVLERTENGMAHVRCGALEGYMRAGDLRYGAEAMRQVRPVTGSLELTSPVRARAGRSQAAAEVAMEPMSGYEIWGISDTWAQTNARPVYLLGTWLGQEWERALVPLEGGVTQVTFTEYAQATVLPLAGELTFEEAYERGIELALQNPDELTLIPPEKRTSEGLHALEADIFLVYDFDSGEARWFCYYSDDEDYEQSFVARMDAWGNLLAIEVSHG